MVDKEELKKLLRELKSEAHLAEVKKKAEKFLENVDPRLLSLAEQELIQEGMDPEDLRKLCEIHLKALSLKKEKAELGVVHPLSILREEHEIILENLRRFEKTMEKIRVSESFEQISDELDELGTIAHLLVDAEKHHRREEEALFPPLEERGVTGPPRIMRMEHEELWQRKKALKELVDKHETMDYPTFVERLHELEAYIVSNLRSHIKKENNILYPTPVKTLEEKQWKKIKEEFDGIGYCCFTPKREGSE